MDFFQWQIKAYEERGMAEIVGICRKKNKMGTHRDLEDEINKAGDISWTIESKEKKKGGRKERNELVLFCTQTCMHFDLNEADIKIIRKMLICQTCYVSDKGEQLH